VTGRNIFPIFCLQNLSSYVQYSKNSLCSLLWYLNISFAKNWFRIFGIGLNRFASSKLSFWTKKSIPKQTQIINTSILYIIWNRLAASPQLRLLLYCSVELSSNPQMSIQLYIQNKRCSFCPLSGSRVKLDPDPTCRQHNSANKKYQKFASKEGLYHEFITKSHRSQLSDIFW
jgi:hypothetical protein